MQNGEDSRIRNPLECGPTLNFKKNPPERENKIRKKQVKRVSRQIIHDEHDNFSFLKNIYEKASK